jgi:trehalose 6-phosphate synthase/phosphatase
VENEDFEVQPSAGGLAAALQAARGESGWIGWPGTVVPEALEPAVEKRLRRDNFVPIFLSADEFEDFYGKVCNETLWPILHYFGDRLRLTPEAWQRYARVNERFAEAILEHSGPD